MSVAQKLEKLPGPVQNLTSLLIGFIFIFIGLPIWWKTTETYRVPLSHSEIDALPLTILLSTVEFEVIILASSSQLPQSQIARFGQQLRETLEVPTGQNAFLSLAYKGRVRGASEAELSSAAQFTSVELLDENLSQLWESQDERGRLSLYLVPSLAFPLRSPWVGRFNGAFIPLNDLQNLQAAIQDIEVMLRSVLVNEEAVFHAFNSARGTMRLKPDKESMRALKSAAEYQLTFSLLVAKPEEKRPVKWDIKGAVDAYLQPLVDELSPFAKLHVDSQVLYYVSLPTRPHFDAASGTHYLNPADLPHVVNPIEGKLVSHVTTLPIIHFLVYVPPSEHSPLYLHDEVGDRVPSNAFISARWGGMVVVNPPVDAENRNESSLVHIDMHPIFEVFLSQLRLLLHFDARPSLVPSMPDLEIADPVDAALARWELSAWLRRRGLENLATASATLKSLSDLLEKIQNMVINDEVGRDVEKALRACQKTAELMQAGSLSEAYKKSREALELSEKAFFDQSLLELLYFPDDQKFAIYMPLFLPIGLPVVGSLIAAFKWLKTLKNKDREKID